MVSRVKKIVALLGLLGGAVAVMAGIAFGSGAGISHRQTIRTTAVGGVLADLALNPNKHNQAGNEFVASAPLYRHAGHTRVGHVDVVCFGVDRSGITVECTTTAYLPAGEITASGPIRFANGARTLDAITGGTDMYRNVRGQLEYVQVPQPNTIGLNFYLQP
jgi:hypothetical protein